MIETPDFPERPRPHHPQSSTPDPRADFPAPDGPRNSTPVRLSTSADRETAPRPNRLVAEEAVYATASTSRPNHAGSAERELPPRERKDSRSASTKARLGRGDRATEPAPEVGTDPQAVAQIERVRPQRTGTNGALARAAEGRNTRSGKAIRLRRGGRVAAASAVLLAATLITAPTAAAASAPTPEATVGENAAARAAVAGLTSANQAVAAIPADFAVSAGYEPTLEQGLLVNPGGDCSSPVPLPAEFEIACKAHDLGYDLLRYADAHGQPLTPWARQALDATLEERMHAACTTRPDPVSGAACQAMATIATAAVDLNSRRQDYGPPVHENLFDTTEAEPTTMAVALPVLGSALAFAGFATGRGMGRRANRATAQEVSA
ncbi:hypothetical protein [Nocardia sp. NPDC050406]|uniref:hypothetical protein n=1 Tax=Nocardia sp. NPDC050406 TaxID=3364318 RepID=UPI003797F876